MPTLVRSTWLAGAAVLATLAIASPAPAGDAFSTAGLGVSAARFAAAPDLPDGVTESVVKSGLNFPTTVRWAPDGRLFVAEKSGRILVYDGIEDPTPEVWADFRERVHDFWDRGLLGMALDPQFATRPYVYALYTYDKAPGSSQVPRWGDGCPSPPGATGDGCVVTGRLSRFAAGGSEQVLIEDWCQQYPSHTVGSLAFGPDRALYVSAGDGAHFNLGDFGQLGGNPCGDPPGGVGGAMSSPTAEGGSLRSQDIRTSGDPIGLDGTIIRVDPDTGAALPDNPNAASSDPNARRIVGYGFRNPFRITVRPGTNEVWAGDVGWVDTEEINRLADPLAGVKNFGWPCYEGPGADNGWAGIGLHMCSSLYAQGPAAHATPYFSYEHVDKVVPGESCPTGGSSTSGLAFYPTGGSLGPAYDGALFFADYSRNCIWVMYKGADGLPDPATRQTFAAGVSGPTELVVGPDKDLYYVNMEGGSIRRFRGSSSIGTPTAVATADPDAGLVPLEVEFDGRGSSDPDGDTLTFAWDLDGDGAFDDSTSATPVRTYTVAGIVTVRLRVTDQSGRSDTDTVEVTAGTPPVPVIDTPVAGTRWKTGDTISFAGSATDFEGVPIPASSLTWRLNLEHCNRASTSCHTHALQSVTGASGSLVAPEHEYPSHLELQLTATDGAGLTRTVSRRLDPRVATVTLRSDPPGIPLTLGTETHAAPYTLELIEGSRTSVTAPSPVTRGGVEYAFTAWSDRGERTHEIVPGAAPAAYTATYEPSTTLAVTPASLSFAGPSPAPRTLRVTGGPATATDDVRWLSVAPAGPSDLRVSVDATGLPAGTHRASVRVVLPGAAGSPRLVPVTLTLAASVPRVTPAALAFSAIEGGADPPARTLAVAGAASPISAADDAAWLSAGPAGDTISVWVSTAGLKHGTYTGQVRVAAGNGSVTVPVTLSLAARDTGLVGAWGFDERGGRKAYDASGHGNAGRISGALRAVGRSGGALAFDGVDDLVTVRSSRSLSLRRAMTLAAWVRPQLRGRWQAVLLERRRNGLAYGLYAGTGDERPSAHLFTSALRGPAALGPRRWTHVAMTYDGLLLRLYVNGRRVASRALAGAAPSRGGPLQIGGSRIRAEWFGGLIDEVRVYDRALVPAEIGADRNRPINGRARRRAALRARHADRRTYAARWLRAKRRMQRAGERGARLKSTARG